MAVYRGTTPLKAYRGDMQPVNVYKGSTKVAGWHASSTSGQSPLAVDCDYNLPPDALTIDGKCVQNTTTGKNLLPSAQSKTINGVTFTKNIDGSITANGTAPANTDFYFVGSAGVYVPLVSAVTYTLSGCVGGSTRTYMLYVVKKTSGGALTYLQQVNAPIAFSVADGDTFRIFIRIFNRVTVSNQVFHQQLELGSTVTPYEPYTGGIPSPNPSYPQPISTITGNVGLTGSDGAASNTATVAFGSAVCASLPDGTHDSYDAVTGVLTKRVGKVVLDGTNSNLFDNSVVSTQVGVYKRVYWGLRILSAVIESESCYVDRFTWHDVSWNADVECWEIESERLCLKILVSRLSADTFEAFKTWLAANPVTVYYKLATPTTVQLTPHLPVVRTGIKTLSVCADVAPTLSATVKSMD
jgi:hypothetical protein